MGAVLITRGSRGMALFVDGEPRCTSPIHGLDEIADVTGRGRYGDGHDGAGSGGGRHLRAGRAAGQLRGRPRGDEARHGHRVRRGIARSVRADGASAGAVRSAPAGKARGRRRWVRLVRRGTSRCATPPAERQAGRTIAFAGRLLRPAARGPRALPAGVGRRGRRAGRRHQRRCLRAHAEGRRASHPGRRRARGARGRAEVRGLRRAVPRDDGGSAARSPEARRPL